MRKEFWRGYLWGLMAKYGKFTKVEDVIILEELKKIKKAMYV